MLKKSILIFTLSIITTHIEANLIVNSKNLKIQELEKEKGLLFSQINAAIDDAVNSLKDSNNSDALLTLNHISELKKQIKELNETEDLVESPEQIFEGSLSTKEPTNDSIVRRAAIVSARNKRIKLDLEEVVNLLKNKRGKGKGKEEDDPETKKKKLEARKEVEKKLEEWILAREAERLKIEAYKKKLKDANKFLKLEKCPNEGIGKRKKSKDDFRRKSKKKKNEKQKKPVYPCCRKCCKRSYMGCL